MPIGGKIASAFSKMMKSKGGQSTLRAVDNMQSMATGISIPKTGAGWKKTLPWMPPALYASADFGKQTIYDPIKESLNASPYSDRIKESRERNRLRVEAIHARSEYEDLQRRMVKATMQLAASDPHLYNEIMAGRSLPKDAVVFGGQPRQDLMEELAMGMAQERFKKPPSAQDELMQELGV